MFRILFLIIVGVAIGYFVGFNDAQKNDKNIVSRLVLRVGGDARKGVGNDIDSKYDKVGR